MTKTHEFAWALDAGRVRHNNEDAVLVDADIGAAVLADGMGGYNAGEVASEMATSRVRDELGRWWRQHASIPPQVDVTQAMQRAVNLANRTIFDAAQSDPRYQGMGTTLVMACLLGDRVLVGHVGDSRAYRLRQGNLERLTRDHSLLQEQLDAGLITPEQAARSVHRSFITRAIGVEAEVALETHAHGLAPGDLLMLCSDGLTDMLDDSAIQTVWSQNPVLDDACRALVNAANAAGGRDNISLVLIRPLLPEMPVR